MTSDSTATGTIRDILLEGDLTIGGAPAIQSRFMEALASGEDTCIRIGAVDGVDVTCLQLICAFHRTAIGRGRHVTLDNGGAPAFAAFTQRAGFCRHQGCRFNPTASCLWVKEEDHE